VVEIDLLNAVREVLGDVLQLGERSAALHVDSGLLGELSELDSMAVVTIITGLEDRFGFIVEDDELVGDVFETLGSLTEFVVEKLHQ